MANLNHHLKNNKMLVFFTIFAFIYMSCFSSCSKPKNQEKLETAQESGKAEKGKNSEVTKVEAASSSEGTISDMSSQSEKSDDPCAGCPPEVDASGQNTEQKKPLTQEELNQMADKLERYFQALEEAIKEIPRDTFDPQAIVDKVGKDPEALFKWVRDNTYLVPYRGVLRGPVGVLMDRIGNSLDRALLLYELMRSAGHNIQLASGILSADQAKEIWSRVRPFPASNGQESAGFSLPNVDEIVAICSLKYQMDEAETHDRLEGLRKRQNRLEKKLENSVSLQTLAIRKSIEKFMTKIQQDPQPEFSSIKNHWWIQWNKDDSWVDLDPTLPDAKPGLALTEAITTYRPDGIDKDLLHHLTIRVLIERWGNGSLEEDIVLEHNLNPYELLGKRIAVMNLPLNWPPSSLNLSEEQNPLKAQSAALLSMSEWMPILTIGSNQINNYSFTNKGEINKTPDKKQTTGRSSGLLGGFGRALQRGDSTQETKKETFLTAEWLEYELSSPGQQPVKIRRSVFDGLGPAVRSNKNVPQPQFSVEQQIERNLILSLGGTEILPQVCQFSADFMAHELAAGLIQNKPILTDIVVQREPLKIDEDFAKKLEQLPSLPSPLSLFIMSRLEFSRLKQFYLDKPNLFNFVLEPSMDAQGNVSFRFIIDILCNEWAVLPSSGSTGFLARLEQGVLETNLEALFIGTIGKVGQNTAQLYEQSLNEGREWVLIQNDQDPTWTKARVSTNVRALIDETLRGGYWALVPQKPHSIEGKELTGWWRIHPLTGDTLGIMESGRGQGLTDYAITVLKKGAPFWLMLGCKAVDLKRGICDPCAIFAFSLLWTGGKVLISLANWVQGETVAIALLKVFLFKGPAWLSLLINSLNLFALVGTVDPCLKRISS